MKYLIVCLTLLMVGCSSPNADEIKKSDYASYRDYWFDKTIRDVGPSVAEPIESTFDFGILPPNVERSHRFTIQNNGENPLCLLVGPKTCKCTSMKILDRIIEPSKTGEVELTWTTVEFAKKFSHSGSVYTNDPNQPKIKFRIKGKVAREFGLSPNQINFPRIMPDSDAVENQIFLFSGEWNELKISSIRSTFGEDLSTELSPALSSQLKAHSAKSGYNLRVKLKPPTKPGWFNGKITLAIAGGGSSFEHSIDVGGKVIRRISLIAGNDATLSETGVAGIGRVESQLGKKIEFLLKVNDRVKQIAIRDSKVIPSFIDVELTPLNNNVEKHGVYRLSLNIPKGSAPALFDREGNFGAVHLEFDHSRVKPLDFKLNFFIID